MYSAEWSAKEGADSADSSSVVGKVRTGAGDASSTGTTPAWANAQVEQDRSGVSERAG
jgi:hypothetical protein